MTHTRIIDLANGTHVHYSITQITDFVSMSEYTTTTYMHDAVFTRINRAHVTLTGDCPIGCDRNHDLVYTVTVAMAHGETLDTID